MTGISAAYAGQGHGNNGNQIRNSNSNQPCEPIQNPNQVHPIQNPNQPYPIQNPNQSGGKGHHGW